MHGARARQGEQEHVREEGQALENNWSWCLLFSLHQGDPAMPLTAVASGQSS